jgi:hypothetical protein
VSLSMGGYLVDTNVVLDVVRLVLVAKPFYEAVMKDLKDVEAMRQVASAVDGINRRWLVFCFWVISVRVAAVVSL